MYAAEIAGDKHRVAVKIGHGHWEPNGGNWKLASAGKDFAVWEQN